MHRLLFLLIVSLLSFSHTTNSIAQELEEFESLKQDLEILSQDPQLARRPGEQTLLGISPPELYKVEQDDDVETRLMKERINCLYAEREIHRQRYTSGANTLVFYIDAQKRLLNAQLEFEEDPKRQRELFTEQLRLAKDMEDRDLQKFRSGVSGADSLYKSKVFRIESELALLRFDKANANGKPDND